MKRPSIMSGSGTHARDGMIMAYGPDFENNKSLEADIIDVASTILELFGEECIKNADGRILKELLR
jgi:predicted AlkP superfamily phosphohydrolase/phosphomutase